MLDIFDGSPRAIDTHAHQPTDVFIEDAGGEMMRDAARKFGAELETKSYEAMIEEYREAGVDRTVLLGWDAETNTGNPPVPNDHVAEALRSVEDFDRSGFTFQQNGASQVLQSYL